MQARLGTMSLGRGGLDEDKQGKRNEEKRREENSQNTHMPKGKLQLL